MLLTEKRFILEASVAASTATEALRRQRMISPCSWLRRKRRENQSRNKGGEAISYPLPFFFVFFVSILVKESLSLNSGMSKTASKNKGRIEISGVIKGEILRELLERDLGRKGEI